MVTFVAEPPKLHYLVVLSWNDADHLERVAAKAKQLRSQMVGDLYTRILSEDIDALTQRIRELRGSQS